MKLYKRIIKWFDINLGWFFFNGRKHEQYKNYLKEAKVALDAARKKLGWSAKDTNGLIFSQIRSIPRIGKFLKAHYGYSGSYIDKQDMKSLNSLWSIEQKTFLP